MRTITGTFYVSCGLRITFVPNINLSPDEKSEIAEKLIQIGVVFESPKDTSIFHINDESPEKTAKCIEYAKSIGLSELQTMVRKVDQVMETLQKKYPRLSPNGEALTSAVGWERGKNEASGNYFIGSPYHFQSCRIVPRIVWEPLGGEKWTPTQRIVPMKIYVWASAADTKLIDVLRSCFTDEELIDAGEEYGKWSNPHSTPRPHFEITIRFNLENPPLNLENPPLNLENPPPLKSDSDNN